MRHIAIATLNTVITILLFATSSRSAFAQQYVQDASIDARNFVWFIDYHYCISNGLLTASIDQPDQTITVTGNGSISTLNTIEIEVPWDRDVIWMGQTIFTAHSTGFDRHIPITVSSNSYQDGNREFILARGGMFVTGGYGLGLRVKGARTIFRVAGGEIHSDSRDLAGNNKSGTALLVDEGKAIIDDGVVNHIGSENAIRARGNALVIINGGTVSKLGSTGSTISVENKAVVLVRNSDAVTASGGATKYSITGKNGIVIETSSDTTFPLHSNTGITVTGSDATAFWAVEEGINGIRYKRGTNKGFIPITDVTLTASGT